MNESEISKKIGSYEKEDFNFTDYCLSRMDYRAIDKEDIFSCIDKGEILRVDEQKVPHKGKIEKRYKITYKLSGKYYLLVVVSFDERILNVINVIKTSKNLEEKWRKKITK